MKSNKSSKELKLAKTSAAIGWILAIILTVGVLVGGCLYAKKKNWFGWFNKNEGKVTETVTGLSVDNNSMSF